MAQGLPRRNAPKNAVGTESIRIFWGISTQDYLSLAGRTQVLGDEEGADSPPTRNGDCISFTKRAESLVLGGGMARHTSHINPATRPHRAATRPPPLRRGLTPRRHAKLGGF